MTPTLSMSPQVMDTATVWYIRGTNIGDNPDDTAFEAFTGRMLTGSNVAGGSYEKIDYPASFWPVSGGGLSDPTFDQSVAQGLSELDGKPQTGDVIYGFSQGAVVASEYKAQHPDQDVTYVLVENPDRPNGGILERFNGVSIPILGITFNGATPNTGPTGPHTVDISRQYDGWSDFPTYPLNVLATANAIAGIYYLHGKTQSDVTAEQVAAAKNSGDPMYYQNDTATNTEYYLIPTDELPLLMPFNGIVPKPILDAIDPPLRVLVELGYDRTDYGTPTPAGIAPVVNPITVATDLVSATTEGVAKGLNESGSSTLSGVAGPIQLRQAVVPQSKAPSIPDDFAALKSAGTPKVNPLPLKLPTLAHNKNTATSPLTDNGSTAPKPAHPTVKAPSPKDVTKAAANAVNKVAGPKQHQQAKHQSDGDS
jgi:pimeloyl-ACP methyl ester carboxylesterase